MEGLSFIHDFYKTTERQRNCSPGKTQPHTQMVLVTQKMQGVCPGSRVSEMQVNLRHPTPRILKTSPACLQQIIK